TALKRITPALRFLSKNGVDGFIAPGHVAAVTGYGIFEPIAHEFLKPFCVAGFSPGNILAAIENLIAQISRGEHTVKNLYPSVVTHSGNTQAMARISDVFEVGDAHWRGLCDITNSGLYLKKEFADFDAGSRDILPSEEICSCGDVILGKLSPPQCHMYGTACTPQTPQGPCMVSSEGACGIWYKCGLGDL
ncbi:MAG: hydrogenase formation protein HypD, partial [Clostridia bacterium]